MQSKNYNAYRITHKDGSIEDINAVDLIQALENMDVQETESKVIQAFLVKENVRTLVADEPTEILFNIVTEGGVGSIATPMTGRIHVGDQIQLKAIPERNYEFVAWKLNGEIISTEKTFLLTMPELPAGLIQQCLQLFLTLLMFHGHLRLCQKKPAVLVVLLSLLVEKLKQTQNFSYSL